MHGVGLQILLRLLAAVGSPLLPIVRMLVRRSVAEGWVSLSVIRTGLYMRGRPGKGVGGVAWHWGLGLGPGRVGAEGLLKLVVALPLSLRTMLGCWDRT